MSKIIHSTVPDAGSGTGSAAPTAPEMMQKAIKAATASPNTSPSPAMNPNPHYGDGSTYGSGIRYAVGEVSPPLPMGDKVKLDLARRQDDALLSFALNHITKMDDNEYYPTPTPADADFLALVTDYQNALAACIAAKDAQKAATALKDEKRANLELGLNQRGDYVQTASNGNGPVILTSGFDVRNPRTPVGVLPPPTNLSLELNGSPGVMWLRFSGVAYARAYVIQISPANTMERNWTPYETTTATRYHCEGLTLGQTYAFRVAAVGGSTGQSLWSAEVVRMAA